MNNKSRTGNLSLCELTVEDGALVTNTGAPFDAESYSRFKYGDAVIAFEYGVALAKKFIAAHATMFATRASEIDLVVVTSPYKFIPKGASAIVRGFLDYTNAYLWRAGKQAISEIKIHKANMFEGDYGTFSEEERRRLTAGNKLHVAESYLYGKAVVVIDDVRITGAHERNLAEFLGGIGVSAMHFLYVASVDANYAQRDPQIESRMNHTWMDSFAKLSEIVNGEKFAMNARVCKYVLSQGSTPAFAQFVASEGTPFLKELLTSAIGDGYALMPMYRDACEFIAGELDHRLRAKVPQ